MALSFLLSLSAYLLLTGVEGQTSGDLRLVARNGRTSSSLTAGRLEVYYNGEWGTVCDDEFGPDEARIACKQLGFTAGYRRYATIGSSLPSFSASGSTRTWLDSLSCSGLRHTRLIDCAPSGTIGIEDCNHIEDIALFCLGNGALRLSSSSFRSSSAGRVEVYYNGVWGTVCDDFFGQPDADVACQQLGYGSASRYGSVVALGYRQGSGTIWLDDLRCTSSELMLSTCSHRGFGIENCVHSEDVAVSCSATVVNSNSGQLRLVARDGRTSPSLTAGRLEVFYNGEWGTVCEDEFGRTAARIACKQLGFTRSRWYTNVSSRFSPASSTTPIWLDQLSCDSFDMRLIDCVPTGTISDKKCDHSKDVVLFCLGNGSLSLSPGLRSSSGRLNVYYMPNPGVGFWGSVCDSSDSFGQTEADVACQQLGFASALRYGSVGSLGYSQSNIEIFLDNLMCTSSELMLTTCSQSGFPGNAYKTCGHHQDVAISCTSSISTPTSSTDSDLTSAEISGIVIAVLVPLCCVGICITVAVIAVCTGACKATSSSRNRRSNVAMTTIPASTATATDVTSTGAKTDFGGGKSNDPPPPYKPYFGTTAYPTQGQAAPPPYPQAGNFDPPQPGYPAEQQQPPYPTDGSELQQYPAADPQVYPPQTGGGYPPPQVAQQASYPVEAGQLPQQYPAYPPQPHPAAGYPPTKEDEAKIVD